MTPQLRGKILELFGVAACRDCGGTGKYVGVYDADPSMLPPIEPCPRCDGAGRSLADATGSRWPWWWSFCTIESTRFMEQADELAPFWPYLPDFATDDGAAVRLAVEMGRHGLLQWIQPPYQDGELWFAGCDSGPTLGAALLAALEASL